MEIKNKTKKSLEEEVEKVYFLVHPAFTSMCGHPTPDYLFERWQKKINEIDEKEILIVFSASSDLDYKERDTKDRGVLKQAKGLGRRCFVFFFDPSANKIINLLKARKFAINPKTVESEAFGEYYQLCVIDYAADYNKRLKFCKPTYINKELSYDARDTKGVFFKGYHPKRMEDPGSLFSDEEKRHITFSKRDNKQKQDKTR